MVCMALLVVSLAETILIVRLVHKQDLQQPVPTWLRHLVLERIARLLCLQEQVTSQRLQATSQAAKTDDCSGEREEKNSTQNRHFQQSCRMWWESPRVGGVQGPRKHQCYSAHVSPYSLMWKGRLQAKESF